MFFYSFKNLFSPPATLKEGAEVPKNYRGLIEYREETCIYCKKCEMVCPSGAIIFTYPEEGDAGIQNPPGLAPVGSKKLKFHYNPYLCIYCGECVRACPKEGTLIQKNVIPEPATAEAQPNEKWFEIEKEAVETKEKWLKARKQKRNI